MSTAILPRKSGRRSWHVFIQVSFTRFSYSADFLRHTYATRLFELGEPGKTVQELLGHSDINVTLGTYTHVLEKQKIKTASLIDALYDTELIPDENVNAQNLCENGNRPFWKFCRLTIYLLAWTCIDCIGAVRVRQSNHHNADPYLCAGHQI